MTELGELGVCAALEATKRMSHPGLKLVIGAVGARCAGE